MKILALDTSTWTGGVAVLRDETLVVQVLVTSPKTHTKRLLTVIDSALHMADMELQDCDGFAVTIGPGSFTGLRIGISAVKGLAYATGKPVTGVSTLEALSLQFPWYADLVCPMLDARKGQVFTALFRPGHDAPQEEVVSECATDPEPWLAKISEPCLFVGDGSVLYRDLIRQELGARARFAPPYLNNLQASTVAYLGMKQIREGNLVDVAVIAPNYIRKSDAESNIEGKRGFVDK